MAFIHRRRGWEIPERLATPEDVYLNRRSFLAAMGFGAMSAMSAGCDAQDPVTLAAADQGAPAGQGASSSAGLYPAKRNEKYKLDRKLTDEAIAGRYNNFYEFHPTSKELVALRARNFKVRPWTIEVKGLVRQEKTIDFDELLRRFPLEERLYRFRCVEAWGMAVPWTGIPLKTFIDWCEPKSDAKFVRFVTVNRPAEMPGMKEAHWYPWPYYEGLTMAEATNELTLLTTGIYGHAMPVQHGAPVRVVVPWKYGYKSPKSIVRIEFVEKQPKTFWNDLEPAEYGFLSNVEPGVPHPRWSQATERLIDTGERVRTLRFNGYGEYVGHLYG
jgi:sulfoxide reductase catalytic subunit YedY